MNIVVSIKQVPDTTEVRINPETNTLIREGVPSIVNPFDMYAIEEAIRLKERFGGTTIVITMGPPQAKEALKTAISMGIDEAVLVSDRAFAGSDTWATSLTLASTIKKLGNIDLVVCGKQAMDGDTAQVGPGIAEHLQIPFVAYVKKVEDVKDGKIRVQRLMEEGYDVIEMSLPALITVVKEINEPRIPGLKGLMRSKKIDPKTMVATELSVNLNEIGLKGSPTLVTRIFSPQPKGKAEILSGVLEHQVETLITKLREQKIF
jgi:electron transfer flavoprotein beta subunit